MLARMARAGRLEEEGRVRPDRFKHLHSRSVTGWLFQANISPIKPISVHPFPIVTIYILGKGCSAPTAARILFLHPSQRSQAATSSARVSPPQRNPCSVCRRLFSASSRNQPTCAWAAGTNCKRYLGMSYTAVSLRPPVADGNIWFAWQLARVA